jgi:SpoVK/Ycf46/Vps4 family AAA+-type ATPase
VGPGWADRLASEFDLDASEIALVAAGSKEEGDVWARARAFGRPLLESLAQRLTPRATWDDIVLAPEPTRLLRTLAAQVRHRSVVYDEWGWRRRTERGLGISALFTGESGTGKTMAAEVLANDLDVDLYRVDLSGVVSKYIGETEKNLRGLFDAVERGGAILFFDEADALFGKRSEVRDSHDRYANIEVDYLLQRMESFRGLAILATNLRTALDPAFTRRLRFIVPFALPGQGERERMWRRAFPPQVPLDGVDPVRLSRLNLSGALIHSIALHASFLAADAASPVTLTTVLDAARTELRKLERPTNDVDSL